MQHPRVCKVTAKEDLRDTVEEQKVPTDGGEELIPQITTDGDGKVPECTSNKIDEARSNDDTRKISEDEPHQKTLMEKSLTLLTVTS